MITMMIARETEVDIYTLSHNCVWGLCLQWEQSCLHQVSRMQDIQSVWDQRTLHLHSGLKGGGLGILG